MVAISEQGVYGYRICRNGVQVETENKKFTILWCLRCFAEYGEEMHQNLKRTSGAFVFLLNPIVFVTSSLPLMSAVISNAKNRCCGVYTQ